MCIIAISAAGIPQPDEATLRRMFEANPHGAGYMVARGGAVEISKGFMTWEDFRHAVRYERFTDNDAVVYHFRISTQAGVNPEMTHPFPLTAHREQLKTLDCAAPIGIAHNGVISLTSDPRQREYSDTALFISRYLSRLIRSADDLRDSDLLDGIQRMIGWSRMALMDGSGYIATIGDFIEDGGILYSNATYRPARRNYSVIRGFFDDEPTEI